MAELTYNGIELKMLRTINFASEPVMSFDDVDYLYSHITIECVGVWSPPLDIQSGSPVPLGLQMAARLKEALEVPRKHLLFTVSGQTVIDLPANLVECDSNNGPKPISARVLQITGDKTAIVSFAIECWDSDCSNTVLSNAWTVRTETTQDAFTVRYIDGMAKLDAAQVNLEGVTADNFRKSYFPACPTQFKRDVISATLSTDATELEYHVVDTELALAIGADGVGGRNISRIEGMVTAGVERNIGDFARWTAAISGELGKGTGGWFNPGAWPFMALSVALNTYNAIATNKANCSVRVYGNRLAIKQDMIDVACAVAMERLFFGPFIGSTNTADTVLASAYMTQSVSERWVEVRCEVLPPIATKIATTANAVNFGAIVNVAANYSGNFQGVSLNFVSGDANGPTGDGPTMFNNNSRGSYMGALLVQALGVECSVPPLPPPNADNVNLPLE